MTPAYTALLESSIAVKTEIEARTCLLLFSRKSMRWVFRAAKAQCAITAITIAGARVERSLERHRQKSNTRIEEQPMTPLANLRQEAFAHLVAAGHSATAAYARAYGRDRDVTSRVNGNRLLTKASIRDRIAQIRHEAASNSLPMLQQVIKETERRTIERIRGGAFKQACEATERFAEMVIKLANRLPSH